jgi:hypothetical protein
MSRRWVLNRDKHGQQECRRLPQYQRVVAVARSATILVVERFACVGISVERHSGRTFATVFSKVLARRRQRRMHEGNSWMTSKSRCQLVCTRASSLPELLCIVTLTIMFSGVRRALVYGTARRALDVHSCGGCSRAQVQKSVLTRSARWAKSHSLTFGVVSAGNVTANLMTAGITAGAAASCSDTIGNLKVGHMVGANPRKQFIAQLFGVLGRRDARGSGVLHSRAGRQRTRRRQVPRSVRSRVDGRRKSSRTRSEHASDRARSSPWRVAFLCRQS